MSGTCKFIAGVGLGFVIAIIAVFSLAAAHSQSWPNALTAQTGDA